MIVLAVFAVAGSLIGYTIADYLRARPPTVNFTAGHATGQPVNLTLQTVGAIGYGPTPNWVSYLTKSPSGKWVHTTVWKVPENTRINVTVYEYDSGSPLRNQAIGQVTGVQGGTATLNGKPFNLINSFQGNGVAHTFTMPALGISVPLYGVNGSAKTFCSTAAPCHQSALHNTIKFSFMSGNHPGEYRWQCFVPCGLATVDGNGGPMQAVGYMGGFMKVVA
ncbi:MAG: hypothetical protein M0Z87_02200 [Actinomycetota bacterium]|nr:hypothetical protein [Actinomycetota bacterium]